VKLRTVRDYLLYVIIYHPILKGSEYENENQVYPAGIVFDFRNASGEKDSVKDPLFYGICFCAD